MNISRVFAICSMLAGIALMSQSSALARDRQLPLGWRVPTELELNYDWRRQDVEKYSRVSGDFNGDGLADEALQLISSKGRGLGLFVYLSQNKKPFKLYRINLSKDAALLEEIGIAKVLPGKYDTACGKGYWTCKTGEAAEISIKRDSISFFKTESASSIFYWDGRAGKFQRIWISD